MNRSRARIIAFIAASIASAIVAFYFFRSSSSPRIAFLSPALGASNLFVGDLNGAAKKITDEPNGVYDYAVSPDGKHIAYSVNREADGPRDLWLINTDGTNKRELLRCDDQVCQSPSWAADNRRIAYERADLVQRAVGKFPDASRVWLMDIDTGQTLQLVTDETRIGAAPRWAPTSDKLAYHDKGEEAIIVIDTLAKNAVAFPSIFGEVGAWSPDASQMIYVDLVNVEQTFLTRAFRANTKTGAIEQIATPSGSSDTSFAWSPKADRIAFARRAGQNLAPQIWISNPDGSESRAITNDPQYSHLALSWSSDGQWLLTQRINLFEIDTKPEVWLVRVDGAEMRLLAKDAALPTWVR
jgi:Tol biopolymer transport system component